MGNRKRLVESAKTGLIILLVFCAVFLGGKTGMFDQIAEAVRGGFFTVGEEPSGTEPASGAPGEAARPTVIVLTGEESRHCGIKYSKIALDAAYDKTSDLLGEALGSAASAERETEEQWRAALSSAGVCFDFDSPLSLPLLASWLGTAMDGGLTARRVCLSVEGETVRLSFQGEDGFYGCDTAVAVSSLLSVSGEYMPNGAAYSFELGGAYDSLSPYDLLLSDAPDARTLAVTRPLDTAARLETALEVFGVRYYLTQSYPEDDGTEVYVENDCTVRVSADGTLRYRSSGDSGLAPAVPGGLTALGEAVERARSLTALTLGRFCGDAELRLLSAEERDGVYTVRFGYFVDGCRVELRGGAAATVTVEGGLVTAAELTFRAYALGGERVTLLPERQAAAIAAGLRQGGELVLAWSDSGGETLTPEWIVR